MIISEEDKIKNEIIKIALISAKTFSYYKSKNQNAGNFYVGENEIEGQCSDYALDFVTRWNKKHPKNEAEIVVTNQDYGIQSGSYKVIKDISDLIKKKFFKESGLLKNVPEKNGEYINLVLYHPNLGYYEMEQTKSYEIKQHFGVDMLNKGPHVWAKVGDIAVDPCWADTDNTPFIGEDIINEKRN